MVFTQITTSSVFASYEEDFLRLQRAVRDNIAIAQAKGAGSSASSRSKACREADESHKQASQALQQMDLEAKSMGALAHSLTSKLKDYRSDLATTRRLVRDAEATLQRDGLLGSDMSTESQRMSGDTLNRLRNSTRRLDDTRRTALEAEEIGMDVMTDLNSQRESIMRTKAHLQDADENMNISKRVLGTLGHRYAVNQLTVGLLAVVLTLTTLVVIYEKFQRIMQRLR
eukprot:TRINITY_DN74527_c0_g1_i1.p1 TRINITY_DN74527_c0_g1~~TRINITY_DN74527_c0_g1_i1.p1  ORF type:complete len:228 (-),score=26.01 TRINITY_DN74527_c0_g1_i1:71-754(-)